jgi:VIT1/CCC1 family predicted Fe2+/Mn2+ transporter
LFDGVALGISAKRSQHRDLHSGAVRAAVFGVSDGLITNLSLILGISGANSQEGFVRLAGLAGLVAGACSMAAGEYVSMAAQKELLERELAVERSSLATNPDLEKKELESTLESRGLSIETAETLSTEVMRKPELALETHAREELGIDPQALGSPIAAGVSSLAAFALGAGIPLAPWFLAERTVALIISITLSAVTALAIGALIGFTTNRRPWLSAVRQLGMGVLAGGITYAIGSLLGVQAS